VEHCRRFDRANFSWRTIARAIRASPRRARTICLAVSGHRSERFSGNFRRVGSREKTGRGAHSPSRAVDAYKVAVKISMERYRLGSADYFEVLQEQQLLFPAENSLVQTQLNQLLAVVQLYRALGGGWHSTNEFQ